MDSIFIKEVKDGVNIVYMDDILIYAITLELLEKYTKQVLHKLQDHNLFLKAKKCEFNKEKVEYLRLVIEEGKVSTDPIKWRVLQTGQSLKVSRKFNHCLDLETSTKSSFLSFPPLLHH